jgi:hypothetical protein
MRHLIVGTFLVLAALAVTSVTATLLERAAMNRQAADSAPPVVVEHAPPAGKPKPGGEFARQVILVSRRLASGFKE